MIHLSDLTITQKGFRSPQQLPKMVEFVSTGGMFNIGSIASFSNYKDLRLINIVRFEDGRHFIHDGHHRVASIYLGGRSFVYANEYCVSEWCYEDYVAINFDKRWITPFDPRFEVRVSDYGEFKSEVWLIHANDGEAAAEKYIREHKIAYAMPRRALTIEDLIKDL